jgi:hypothetical protein
VSTGAICYINTMKHLKTLETLEALIAEVHKEMSEFRQEYERLDANHPHAQILIMEKITQLSDKIHRLERFRDGVI